MVPCTNNNQPSLFSLATGAHRLPCPSFCRALVSDRDSPVAPCFCSSMCDSDSVPRRRRHRHSHCHLLSRALLLLLPLARAHDRDSDDRACRACRARPPHDRVQAEHQDDCGSYSGRTRTAIPRVVCCPKTRALQASLPSFSAGNFLKREEWIFKRWGSLDARLDRA